MSLRGRQDSSNLPMQMVSFLVVRLGDHYVALPADGVRGVLTREEAGKERDVTAAGVVYESVDLAQRFSVMADMSGSELRIVLYSNGRSHGAIRVTQVMGLTDIARKDCLPLPPQFQCDERHWFDGMMLYQDQLVLILNPSWVLGELADVVSMPLEPAEKLVAVTPAAIGGSC